LTSKLLKACCLIWNRRKSRYQPLKKYITGANVEREGGRYYMRATRVDIAWNPELSIYASEAFLKTVSGEYGWMGGIDQSDKLLCVLPYSVIRKSVFCLIRFPTQTIMIDEGLDIEKEREFLNRVVEYFRSIEADVIIPATVNTIFRTYPDGAKAAPYGSYILNLNQGEEAIWSNLHSKHRNVIRNAMKKGVKIRSGLEYIETAYKLVKDSFRRSASGFIAKTRLEMRMDYDAFKHQVLGFGENVRVFVAEFEGVAQGCAVIPFSHHSAYYMHGGSIASPLTGAMNFIQWEAIRQFCELGVRHYDFCGARIDPEKGSKAEGLIMFKERFGGHLTKGFMWKFPLRPNKYFLYSLAARLRSGGDVVDQESHKLNKR
jgi:lipid II:glycine glycyltransferase (peptidoglycan interpeptide bridge formation enzyme)